MISLLFATIDQFLFSVLLVKFSNGLSMIKSPPLFQTFSHIVNSVSGLNIQLYTQQLLAFVSNIQNSFSSKSQTDVIYLDFKLTLCHIMNSYIVKLWSFGITGNLWKWFQAYLSGRSQCVRLNHCMCDPLPVLSGVRSTRQLSRSTPVLNIYQ